MRAVKCGGPIGDEGRRISAVHTSALLCAFALAAALQGPLFPETMTGEFTSGITGQGYSISISLPEGYHGSNLRYRVVYLLDGDRHFEAFAKVMRSRPRLASRFIIVGVGYEADSNERRRDYTPSPVDEYPGSGGAEDFFMFLRQELIPYIDGAYRTVRRPHGRCIAGHSYGGIAVYYGLLFHYDLFNSYIAVSPSLWWDDRLFFRLRKNLRGAPWRSTLSVYTAAGSREDRSMIRLSKRFARELVKWGVPSGRCGFQLIDGEDHEGVAVAAIMRGLDFALRGAR